MLSHPSLASSPFPLTWEFLLIKILAALIPAEHLLLRGHNLHLKIPTAYIQQNLPTLPSNQLCCGLHESKEKKSTYEENLNELQKIGYKLREIGGGGDKRGGKEVGRRKLRVPSFWPFSTKTKWASKWASIASDTEPIHNLWENADTFYLPDLLQNPNC